MQRSVRPGSTTTLVACTLHFTFCFSLWTLVAAIGNPLAREFALTPLARSALVAAPLLAGALLRIPAGWLGERYGMRRVGCALLIWLHLPLIVGMSAAHRLWVVALVAVFLGAAGSSFAVAIPLAGAAFPPERRGFAIGVVSVGTLGGALALGVAPRIAASFGWHAVFGAALAPLTMVLLVFIALTRKTPGPVALDASRGARLVDATLVTPALLRVCALYALAFGGFVGLAAMVPFVLGDGLGASSNASSLVGAGVALAGSLARPVGGVLADRHGSSRTIRYAFVAAAASCTVAAVGTALAHALVPVAMIGIGACLGLASGAVLQYAGARLGARLAPAMGFVGAAGGLGAFAIPIAIGAARQATGNFATGFGVLATLALVAAVSNERRERAAQKKPGPMRALLR